MELIKKRIHYIREGKKIFDQFYVDEDYNVPEAKEDVGSIVFYFNYCVCNYCYISCICV